jgi:VIT1/CCC1 family predicted Fe2+/Mn2+ transporter
MTHTMNDRSADSELAGRAIDNDALADRTTADLVKLAAEQVARLVRDELKLAQTELAAKGKRAGMGIGMFGAAGIVALYGVAALLAAAIIGLAAVLPAWLSALLIGVVLLAVGAVLALIGRGQVKRATPPAPTEAVRSVKADLDTITGAVKERGHR